MKLRHALTIGILSLGIAQSPLVCMEQQMELEKLSPRNIKQFFTLLPRDLWAHIISHLEPSDPALNYFLDYIRINDSTARALAGTIESKLLIGAGEYRLAVRAMKHLLRTDSLGLRRLLSYSQGIITPEFIFSMHSKEPGYNQASVVRIPFESAKNKASYQRIRYYLQQKMAQTERLIADAPSIMALIAHAPANANPLCAHLAEMLEKELLESGCDVEFSKRLKKYFQRDGMPPITLTQAAPFHLEAVRSEPDYQILATEIKAMRQRDPHMLKKVSLALYKVFICLNTYNGIGSDMTYPEIRFKSRTKITLGVYIACPLLFTIIAAATGDWRFMLLNILPPILFLATAKTFYKGQVRNLPWDLYEEIKDGLGICALIAKKRYSLPYSPADVTKINDSMHWPYHACDALMRAIEDAFI